MYKGKGNVGRDDREGMTDGHGQKGGRVKEKIGATYNVSMEGIKNANRRNLNAIMETSEGKKATIVAEVKMEPLAFLQAMGYNLKWVHHSSQLYCHRLLNL